MELETALATALRNNRITAGFSQEELAHRCDLDRTYISLLERSKRKPTLNVVFKICSNLNIKSSEFVKQIEEILEQNNG